MRMPDSGKTVAEMRSTGRWNEYASLCENHRFCNGIQDVVFRPFDGEDRSFEELFVCVLLAHILTMEILLSQLLHHEVMSGNELFFSIARKEDKCLVLETSYN